MPVMKLSSDEYNRRVKGTSIAAPIIENGPISDESIWDFIEKGSKKAEEANPDLNNWINSKVDT